MHKSIDKKAKGKSVRKNLKEKIADNIEIPKEIVLDLPRVTLIGDMDIYIENVKGVIEYTDKFVRLNSSIGIISLSGCDFKIIDITTEDMCIQGKIKSIEIMH